MENKNKIYYFSGTHWDREWYQTFQGFRINLVRVMDELVDFLEQNKDFKVFHLDGQTIVLEDYYEIKPENKERIIKLISQGRIVVGPWYCMPDEFLVSGESLIRNFLLGHKLSAEWGSEAWKFGYLCDIFGHIAQMPQLLKGVGIKYALLGRGTNEHNCPAFFKWKALDGSECITYKVPDKSGYGSFTMDVVGQRVRNENVDPHSTIFKDKSKEYINKEFKRTPLPITVLMDAMDHEPVHKETTEYIKTISEMFPEHDVIHDNLLAAMAEAEKYVDHMPVKYGELNETAKGDGLFLHLITHTLSSRHRLKQENDMCSSIMQNGLEPMFVYLRGKGVEYSQKYLNIAWKNLLQNHPHDSICGCSVDRVHNEMFYRFSQVHSIYEGIMDDAERQLSNGFKRAGKEGSYLSVINLFPFDRNELIVVEIPFEKEFPKWSEPFGYENINSFKIYDNSGIEIPYVIKNIRTNMVVRQFGEKTLPADIYTVAFHAELSAMSTTYFEVKESEKPVRYFGSLANNGGTLDNCIVRVDVNYDGTINLKDYKTGQNFQGLLGLIDDGELGDGWHSVQLKCDHKVISGKLCSIELVADSPIYSELLVTRELDVPAEMSYLSTSTKRSAETKKLKAKFYISLSKDSRNVEVKLEIDNNIMDHRIKLTLKTKITSNQYFVNQAFAFIERDCGVKPYTAEWKEKDQLEKSMSGIIGKRKEDGNGLAFISDYGLHECGADDDVNGTLYITLMRGFSKTYTTNGEIGGQELGLHTYKFILAPLDNEITNSSLQRLQDRMQSDIRSFMSADNTTDLSLIKIDGDICVSAIKPAQDNIDHTIIRLYNPCNETKTAMIQLGFDFSKVQLCDLLEQPINELEKNNRAIEVVLKPWEIVSLIIKK